MRHDEKLAALVRDAALALDLDVGLRLWTGERIGPQNGPTLALNDPTVLARLCLRPRIETAVEAYVTKAIDVENGTIFDLAARRPKVKAKALLKRLGRRRLVALLPALLSLSRQARREAPAGAEASPKPAPAAPRRAPSASTTTCRTASTGSSSTSAWCIPAPTSPSGTTTSTGRRPTSST